MSFTMLLVLLGLGFAHGSRRRPRVRARVAESMLVFVLGGYCGLYMVLASVLDLRASARNESIFPFAAAGATQQFFDVALLGLALSAIVAARQGGRSLAPPAVGWSVFWLGASLIHLAALHAARSLTLWSAIGILSSHAAVALTLAILLACSAKPARHPSSAASTQPLPGPPPVGGGRS